MKQGKSLTFLGVRVDPRAGLGGQLEGQLFGRTEEQKHPIDGVVQNVSATSWQKWIAKISEVVPRWFGSVAEGLSKKQSVGPANQVRVELDFSDDTKVVNQKLKHSDGGPRGLVKDSTVAPVEKGDRQR